MHVIGTAGHVDHGKSTLVEKLTGIDPDRFAEEKRRGLTIDLGFAWLRLPSGNEVGIVDVPGHERFIKNMLAGAGGITTSLFVVAANEGWRPQSAEHLAVLEVLGVTRGVVALTKSDSVAGDELDAVRDEVVEHLASSSLAGAPVIPVSAVTGVGIDNLIAALDEIVGAAPPAPDSARPRLWIDRVFTIAGAGTVVTGTLTGGSLREGDEVEIVPDRRRARIRSIQSHKKKVAEIGPGNRVALNLVGLERRGAERGNAVVVPKQWRSTTRLDVRIDVLPTVITGVDHELTDKGAHLLYTGSAETPVRVRLLEADKLTGGQSGFAHLTLRDPLPLTRGDRFVLRDAGRVLTFGGGVVLDPHADPLGRDRAGRIRLLRKLDKTSDEGAVDALVEAYGQIDAGDAALRLGARNFGGVERIGHMLMSSDRLAELATRITDLLAMHHAAEPLAPGMPRTALRAALDLDADTFDQLLARMDDVVSDGSIVRLTGHHVRFTPEQETARAALIDAIQSAGFTPPLSKDLSADPALVHALVDSGDLVPVGDFFLTRDTAAEARAIVRKRIEEQGPVTVAQIRDLLRTSRKYAVPLCEWLDQTGATVRNGDLRALGPRA